ncbi:MAG TPA: Rne/Rng family ribonuclease [Nitriliruptorales bacterium]|nr:Rne/Rng family ribonuclease [Nitriliruptorales bacterium]
MATDQTNPSGADAPRADTEDPARTRTRTRTRAPASDTSTDPSTPAPAADRSTDPTPAGEPTGSGTATQERGGTGRRRRRGSRGRGRRSGATAATPSAGDRPEDGTTADDRTSAGDDTEPAPVDARETATDRVPTRSQVEDAIARGGTRLAAKRQGRDRRGRTQRRGGTRRLLEISEEVRHAMLDGPPPTMLVTTRDERTQVAVLEDRTVVEHYVTRKEDVSYVGNIYLARVQNVLPGMEAAFLDIGKGRNGVLYAGEVLYDELDLEEGVDQRIEHALKAGQTLLVQVTKDPMGSKGARLTMQMSLAGRYMVLAPRDTLFGISRKLSDADRDRLRRILKRFKPDGMGIIVRTAAAEATEEQLREDLERLTRRWESVRERAAKAKPLEAVYEEPDLVVRVVRDHFGPDFERLVVDTDEVHQKVRAYLEEVMPEALPKLELYHPVPPERPEEEPPTLFEAYHVTEQLRKALERRVWLPSGGYLIIERTEAMTIIDVNTGKFTGSTSLEETVLRTNLEAAEELVRQLRLRDIGGMIIIDFIDMLLKANQDQVVHRLQRELLRDRTKTRVSEVSRLGLVQMTRKNVSQGLLEVFGEKCSCCDGRGVTFELA